MTTEHIHAVTGAFGYSGKYLAEALLREGRTVMTRSPTPRRAIQR